MAATEENVPFYKDAEDYWDNVPATIGGMMGGLENISSIDIATSTRFLKKFLQAS